MLFRSEITEAQRALLLASDDAESARLGKERAQLEEMARAQAAITQAQAVTARQQKRIGRLLRGVAALMIAMFGYLTWQSYDVARREIAVFTSLAVQAMKEGQFDRAMRFALQAYPARGHIPGLTPFSAELEGKLAGGAQSSQLHRVLRGHELQVLSTNFSPDGGKVVTNSEDGTARIWDAESGAELLFFKIPGTLTPILSAVFTPDGKGVLMGVGDGTARIWDATDGHELMVFKGHDGAVYQAIFDPDSKRIATVSRDTTARIWDAQSGRELSVLKGHTAPLHHASFSGSGRRLVTVSREDWSARVWDLETARQIGIFKARDGIIWDAMLTPDGKRLATTDLQTAAKIWDVDSGSELFELKGDSDFLDAMTWQVLLSRDGKRVLTTSGSQALIRDAETGKQIKAFKMPAESRVRQAIFDREEAHVATVSDDNIVRVWDTESGIPVATFTGHTKGVSAIAFAPDTKRLVSASADTTARIWRVEGATRVLFKAKDTGIIRRVAFSPDGQRVVTASSDKTARIWDAEGGHELLRLQGHTDAVWSAAFDPQGKRVVTASSDRTVRIWDAQTGTLVRTLEGHSASVLTAAFDPSGKRIVSGGSDSAVRIWDVESGKVLVTVPHDGWIQRTAFAPDGGRVVATINRGRAYVWNPEDVQHFVALQGHTNSVTDAQFDRAGKRVVTASLDGTVRIWDSTSGKELARLQSATGDGLQSVQFDRDEKLVVAAATNGSAIIFDVASGQEIVALQSVTGGFWGSAAFNPDGTRVLAAHGLGVLRIWDVTWAAKVRGETLRDRVCSEKLVGAAQEFNDIELANPILRSIDKDDPVARNPCLRRGPLSFDYWTRLPGDLSRSARKLWAKD